MYWLLHLFGLFCCIGFHSYAQNLVPNYSFEEYDSCYKTLSNIHFATPWNTPTEGTPDWYHDCTTEIPVNWAGTQTPKTGIGYCGIYTWGAAIPNVREYIQVQLADSLVNGYKYSIEFFVSLADSSDYATNQFGAYISDTAVASDDLLNLDFTPQVVTTNLITNTDDWTRISGTFIANGNEQYITIGNFRPDSSTSVFMVDSGQFDDYAYYYIDDVSVVLDSPITVDVAPDPAQSISRLIYPNPCKTSLSLDLKKIPNSTVSNITLYNISGQKVRRFTAINGEVIIPCQEFESGQYLLHFQNANGSKYSYKLLIE